MTELLNRADTLRAIVDLEHWYLLRGALHATYDAPDVPAAVELVRAAFEIAEELEHHPDVNLRWKKVLIRCATHSAGGVTAKDVELAHRIAAAAEPIGAQVLAEPPQHHDVGIDTPDAARIQPFWAAVLGYDDMKDPLALADPFEGRLSVWFQVTDGASTDRNRLHVDVDVVPEQAKARIDAAIAAGGRLVTDEHAPRWWVLADPDGNEACICTEEGRGL